MHPHEQPHSPSPASRNRVVALASEAGTDDHGRNRTAREASDQALNLPRVVLTVAINLYQDRVSLGPRVSEAYLQSTADAEVHKVAHHVDTRLAGDFSRRVR